MAIQTYDGFAPGVVEVKNTQETNLKAIADAIRAKTGETAAIKATEFPSKIAGISQASKSVKLTVSITGDWSCYYIDASGNANKTKTNGTYSITPGLVVLSLSVTKYGMSTSGACSQVEKYSEFYVYNVTGDATFKDDR